MIEEKLQAAIQHRALSQVIVIQHDQQRALGIETIIEFIKHAAQPLFEGEWLMTLAQLEHAHGLLADAREVLAQAFKQALKEAPWVTVTPTEAQPETLPVVRQSLTELHRQRALAEAGRRADQQQAPTHAILQALAQARPADMPGRQWGTIEADIASSVWGGVSQRGTGKIGHKQDESSADAK
ncbi:hypothetical protein ACF8C6_03660 [Pseudomonas sp. zbq_18]|uniref:hypothetical protein n=1 Tax=Pseudomonas sp. zbq_18 TaxID=3367251 RepID=UPI00370A86B1